MMKKADTLTNVLFVGFLFFFMAMHFLTPDKTFSEAENRVLSKFPEISLNKIANGEAMRGLEKYIQDQFPFRTEFVAAKTGMESVVGKTISNTVYLAQENSLIQQFNTLDENRLSINLNQFNDFINKVNIPVDVVVIPSAAAVNENLLPDFHQDIDQENLLKRIKESLGGANFVDLLNLMKNEKANLFYRTDHHLTALGSYLTYQAYLKSIDMQPQVYSFEEVATDFKGTLSSKSGAFWIEGDPILKPIAPFDIQVTVRYDQQKEVKDSVFNDEKLTVKDKYTYYLDGNHSLVEIDTHQSDKPNLVVITDSYGHSLAPFLISDFNQITMIDLRYYHGPVSDLLEEADRVLIYYGIEPFVSDVNVAFLK